VWDAEAVCNELQNYIIEALGESEAVLVVDETGFLKQGQLSGGVKRQYSATAGRIANCQAGVFVAYASQQGHVLLNRALYLPQEWTDDGAQCRAAGIPAEVKFATKPELARRLLEQAVADKVPFGWVTGESI
jgi:SRSO17 transposase